MGKVGKGLPSTLSKNVKAEGALNPFHPIPRDRLGPFKVVARTIPLIVLLFSLAAPLHAKTPPLKHFDQPRLVDAGELVKVVGHPSVRIVDLRASLSDYLRAHIPKAFYLPAESLQAPRNGIPGQTPDRLCLEKMLGDYLTLSRDMWVVLYSEKSNPNATLLAWTLDFLGHKKVGILNGGWEKWVSERLPTTQEYPSLPPNKFFGKVMRESLAEKKWVENRLPAKQVVIVDARTPKQYSGEEGDEIRRGHIPGARNVFWETTLNGDDVRVWKSKDELERLFAESGVHRDKEIIVYCRTGREASHLYFTLKHVLGFPEVRLYRGSWVEWSMDKTLPVKLGMDP